MQASSTNVVFIKKKYNKVTSERMRVIKFLKQLKEIVDFVYGYKKNNPLLKDMHVYPEEMKIVVGLMTYKIVYEEERIGLGMSSGWNLEYHWFFLKNVVGELEDSRMYYVLDYLLEDVAEKVQAGLNDLPELLPYYSKKYFPSKFIREK